MAETRLSDIIVPEEFEAYVRERILARSALFRSGVVVSNEAISRRVRAGGRLVQMPFWKSIGTGDPTIGSDDPTSKLAAKKMTAGKQQAVKHWWTEGWSAMDLAEELAGDDPLGAAADQVADYWVVQYQKLLISTLVGLMADNAANDSGDMINDIALKAAGTPDGANQISVPAIMDAAQTMGDRSGELAAVAMHSVTFNELVQAQLVQYLRDTDLNVNIPTVADKQIVVDDGIAPYSVGGQTVYRVFLLGLGTFGYGEEPVDRPVEVERDPLAGDGFGMETLISRRKLCLHPFGTEFTDASVAGNSPTFAEVETAGNWNRVTTDRKSVRVAMLEVNP